MDYRGKMADCIHLYGCRPNPVIEGLGCDLGWMLALSVTHSTIDVACAVCSEVNLVVVDHSATMS